MSWCCNLNDSSFWTDATVTTGVKIVHVQTIDDSDDDDHKRISLNKTKPTADIERFFMQLPASAKMPGDKKSRMRCLTCA